MTERTQAERAASRRTLLMCAGLAGAGGASVLLSACSTAAVPYDANEEGQAPGPALAVATDPASATATAPAAGASAAPGKSAAAGTSAGGTLLGQAADIPVGGGMVFTAAKVVVTQ